MLTGVRTMRAAVQSVHLRTMRAGTGVTRAVWLWTVTALGMQWRWRMRWTCMMLMMMHGVMDMRAGLGTVGMTRVSV